MELSKPGRVFIDMRISLKSLKGTLMKKVPEVLKRDEQHIKAVKAIAPITPITALVKDAELKPKWASKHKAIQVKPLATKTFKVAKYIPDNIRKAAALKVKSIIEKYKKEKHDSKKQEYLGLLLREYDDVVRMKDREHLNRLQAALRDVIDDMYQAETKGLPQGPQSEAKGKYLEHLSNAVSVILKDEFKVENTRTDHEKALAVIEQVCLGLGRVEKICSEKPAERSRLSKK